jgi:hypothetical protein
MWKSYSETYPNSEMFNLSTDSTSPNELTRRMDAARAKGIKQILVLTGGGHNQPAAGDLRNIGNNSVMRQLGCCLKLVDPVFTAGADGVMGNDDDVFVSGVAVFNRAGWDAKLATFNTPEIKALIAKGVADGLILGANVMDEPHVTGLGDGNTWGPSGTLTKYKATAQFPNGDPTYPNAVDNLCKATKDMFPTLPVGVAHQHSVFEPSRGYFHCDFIMSQFSYRYGSVDQYIADAKAWTNGPGNKTPVMFSFNPVNGGYQDVPNDASNPWDCTGTNRLGQVLSGRKGQRQPNCMMSPGQIFESATKLGRATCGGQIFWRFYDTHMLIPEVKQAFVMAANVLGTTPLACTLTRR